VQYITPESIQFDGSLITGKRVEAQLDRLDDHNHFDCGNFEVHLSTRDDLAGYFLRSKSDVADYHLRRRQAVALLEGVNYEYSLVL